MTQNQTSLPGLKTFTSRPKTYYHHILIADSDLNSEVQLSSHALSPLLQEIYPSLSLIELFEILIFFKDQKIALDPVELGQAYHFHWNEITEQLFLNYKNWPQDFIDWSKEKNCHTNDLRPLLLADKLSLRQRKDFYLLLAEFKNLKLSLGDGKKVLELLIDLSATEFNHENLRYKNLDTDSVKDLNKDKWMARLSKLRFSMTELRDLKKKEFIKKTAWPSSTKINFKRLGDQSGFEIISFVSSLSSIDKIKKGTELSFLEIQKFIEGKND